MALHPALLHRVDVMTDWTVFSYDLPFINGRRQGLVLRLEDRWGEIAPYPGRSKETLDEALTQLVSVLNGTNQKLLPSVQFGLESALDFPPPKQKAKLYAFLQGSPDEILRQADRAAKEGYNTVKFKVSSAASGKNLISSLKDRFRLRIDCNSKFSFAEAMSIFSPFDPAIFDYIEDPTFEMDKLPDFTYPFALDEKIPLEKYPHLYGFILKPTTLGGRKGCAPFVEFAKKNQLQVVFSPVFESGLGLLQIFSTAHHFQLLENPMGLDTHRSLAEDILLPSVNFNSPDFSLEQTPQVNPKMLKEVAHGMSDLRKLQAFA
jgi:O-succinylbenzoate synthase